MPRARFFCFVCAVSEIKVKVNNNVQATEGGDAELFGGDFLEPVLIRIYAFLWRYVCAKYVSPHCCTAAKNSCCTAARMWHVNPETKHNIRARGLD